MPAGFVGKHLCVCVCGGGGWGGGGGGGGVFAAECGIKRQSVHRGRICRDDVTCCHTEMEAKSSIVIGCLLNVPGTCYCISGMGLLRQLYLLPC